MHSISVGSPPMCSWTTSTPSSLQVNSQLSAGLLNMHYPQCTSTPKEDDRSARASIPFGGSLYPRSTPNKQCDSSALIGFEGAVNLATTEAPRRRVPKHHLSRRQGSGSKASRSPPVAAAETPSEKSLSPSCFIFSGPSEQALYTAEEASLADCNVVLEPLQLRRALSNLPQSAIGSQRHGPIGANVFVFHIPNEWHEKDLALQFAQFGPLLSARIATDKATGRRLGFGFVSYTNIAAACDAVKHLNGHSVAGKRLKVTIKRGEQQHAATFRCELSTAAAAPALHASVPPPPCPLLPDNASETPYPTWNENIKASADPHGRDHISIPYRPELTTHTSPYAPSVEGADEYGYRKYPVLDARSSQQSTNPTASDHEDSSVSDGSPFRHAAQDTVSDQQKRMDEILSILLQSSPAGAEASAEQETGGATWLENLAMLMQSPDDVRFISSLLQLAHPTAAAPPEMDGGLPAFRFPLTTKSGSGSWENYLFESSAGSDDQ